MREQRWDEGTAGPCAAAAVGLSAAGGGGWLGNAGGPGVANGIQMVGAGVPGAEVRAAHHTHTKSSPLPLLLRGTPPQSVASPPLRAGPAASEALLTCWWEIDIKILKKQTEKKKTTQERFLKVLWDWRKLIEPCLLVLDVCRTVPKEQRRSEMLEAG